MLLARPTCTPSEPAPLQRRLSPAALAGTRRSLAPPEQNTQKKLNTGVCLVEVKDLDAIAQSVKEFTDTTSHVLAETSARLLAVEQKLCAPGRGGMSYGPDGADGSDVGSTIVNSDGFRRLQSGEKSSGMIKVGSLGLERKTTVIESTWSSAPQRVAGIVAGQQRKLTVRDLCPIIPTTSQSIEFAKETSTTNNAAYQVVQGDAKPESAIAYALVSVPVVTLAHWIPASRQLLDDSIAFASYINNRMTYLLAIVEERELLFGSGASGHLSGIYSQATTMSTANAVTASDTFADTIAEGIQQLSDADFVPDGIIMNSRDWMTLRRTKTSGGGADNRYLIGNPLQDLTPTLWGLPVVAINSMTQGQFLIGAFQAGCAIYDRQAATVEVSREHSDFFTRNLSAILIEQREALVVFRPGAFIAGGFPFGS
jgi:HK97 family phage major capsid protein